MDKNFIMNDNYYSETAYRSDNIPEQKYSWFNRLKFFLKLLLPWGNTEDIFLSNIFSSAQLIEYMQPSYTSSNLEFICNQEVLSRYLEQTKTTYIVGIARKIGILIPSFLKKSWYYGSCEGYSWSLNRKTGMVTILHNKEVFTAPFYQFDAGIKFILFGGRRDAGEKPYLYLKHRYSDYYVIMENAFSSLSGITADLLSSEWKYCLAQWDFIQNYMDITKPLPNIPELAACRHLDPKTKAYDEQKMPEPKSWVMLSDPMWKEKRKELAIKVSSLKMYQRNNIMRAHLEPTD